MGTIHVNLDKIEGYEENGERMVILSLMVNLHNFQAEMMGMNQIFNSDMNNDSSYYGYNGTEACFNNIY